MVFCNLPFYFHSALNNYLEYFGVYLLVSEKLIGAGVFSEVEKHTPNAYTLSLAHNIGFEEGRVISELLQEPIHRASVVS